jgi:hypothetical protein
VTIEDSGEGSGKNNVNEEVLVPALGFVTLDVNW